MHIRSKLLSLILSLFIVISSFPLNLNADLNADTGDIIMSGTCGDDITWVLDGEGTLTIAGSGDMNYYNEESSLSSVPWWDCHESIICVVIDERITSIDDFAFLGLQKPD